VTKPYKCSAKLERLLEQGTWTTRKIGRRKVPHLAMPTPELQRELGDALDSEIKKHLKKAGWERVCATQREYPLHSALLVDRIDDLTGFRGSPYLTDEGAEAARQLEYVDIEKAAERSTTYDVDAAKKGTADQIERARKNHIKHWSKQYGDFRNMLDNPLMWRATRRYYIMFPPNGSALSETDVGPRPKPVYVKEQSDLLIGFDGNCVNLWAKVDQIAA
jgi:hypothetical protein